MKDKIEINGGCVCGKLRYEIAGPVSSADHCHCSLCRRQHGAAFATYADFKPGRFSWVSGEKYLKVYELASGAGWCFCSECGSSLAASEKGVITSVTLGSVDGDPGIKPDAHIYVGSKAIWYEISDDLPQHMKRDSKS